MDGIIHPKLRQLYAYWLEKGGAHGLPTRVDMDPVDLRFAIGNLLLIEVIEGQPLRFHIRVHGTNLSERVRFDLTGKMLDELPQVEFRNISQQSFTTVATSKQPLHAQRDCVLDDRRRRYETIILPLSSDGDRVDMLLCGLFYDDQRP